ncbi:MAG: glycosyltransferase family 1 protein [Acidobacteria bacterium]|nr:glycosyltransferase family 1 protein [Acidobacteriota bacterium]
MKVAVFSDTFDQINGVAITYKHLVEYAQKNNLQIDIYTQGEMIDTVEQLGSARVFRFKPSLPLKFYSELYFDLRLPNRRILKRVKQEGYDLIHSAALGSMGVNAMLIAKRLNIPLVGSYNTDIPKYIYPRVEKQLRFTGKTIPKLISKPLEKLAWKYIKAYFRRCDLTLTISEYNKVILEKLIKKEVGIFSRGVDTETFNPAKRSLEFRQKHNEVLAVYVGRVSLEKNLEILVDVFNKRPEVKLVVVGDGPFRGEMEKRMKNAYFTGPIYNRDQLAMIYASADFFVFPSETETFGQVVTESLASGLPSIVSDKGATGEQIVQGETGFIFSSREDLEEAMDMLSNSSRIRHEMGLKAREYALTRTWDSVFNQLIVNYRSLIRTQAPQKQIISIPETRATSAINV